ncbi:hypothetical protein [Elizabethkingia occulta]|uniref:hypothetical protein n=1 Tax=Elizabethkingia occulta TaxID=1867263 RepID=UPI0013F629E7|nr:hypothetical protein [Elizabethkingia occulta]
MKQKIFEINNNGVTYIIYPSYSQVWKASETIPNKELSGFKNYDLHLNAPISFKSLEVSSLLYESNFSINKKFDFDLKINSNGIIQAYIRYPEQKKGNFQFSILEEELKVFNSIATRINKQKNNVLLKGTQKRPIAIIIDRTKILNDNNMISQNSDCLALLAFSQTTLLKYIAENNKYKVKTKFNIISSEYTKRFDVPDYPNISR